MKTLTHNCDYGKITYHIPNVADAMILMGEMGVTGTVDDSTNGNLILVGRLIKSMGCLIDDLDLEIEGKKINNYQDALNYFEMMEPLSLIAGEVVKSMEVTQAKKQQ